MDAAPQRAHSVAVRWAALVVTLVSVTGPRADEARGWRLAASVISLLGAVGLSGYVSIVSTGYWLWVATSAYLGIRDKRDIGLGLLSTAFAFGPLVAGGLVGYRSRRRGLSKVRSWRRGSLVALGVAIPMLFLAAALTVI